MELHLGRPITLEKYIELSKEYKEDLKQYKDNVMNNAASNKIKPKIHDEKYVKKA